MSPLDVCSYVMLHHTFHTYSWGRNNVTNCYPFKCNMLKHWAIVLWTFISLWPHVWPLVKFQDVLKVPDNRRHDYDCSPAWRIICTYKWWFWSESTSHTSHLNSVEYLCSCDCICKHCPILNIGLHCSYLNGRSPVWLRICRYRLSFRSNRTSHISHINGRSPLWMCLYFISFFLEVFSASRASHLHLSSP